MKNLLKKPICLKIVLFFFLISFYFFSRFQHLTSIPVFADEAIYLRWSQIIKSVETLRFIPLTDGKQPLFMWLTVPFFKLSPDPLISGRALSIMAGFGSLITIFLITALIKNWSSTKQNKHPNPLSYILQTISTNFYPAITASFLYCLIPLFFFFDRLALADNLLNMFGLFALYLSLLQSRFHRFDLSILLGFVLSLAYITKSPAIFFIVLSILTTFLINYKQLPNWSKLSILNLISLIITLISYNLLRLGPQFQMIATRNKDYVWKLSELIQHPLDPLKPHLIDIFHIYNYFLFPVLLLVLLIFIVFLLLKNKKQLIKPYNLVFLLWWVLPLIANAIFAKVFTARYILYTLPPLFLLLFQIFTSVKNKNLSKIVIILLIVFSLSRLYSFSFQPFQLKLPSTETGYIQDWTSGWGIKASADYLINQAKNHNVIVGTEGFFGTLPDGLQMYTNQIPHLTVFGVGVNLEEIPTKLIDAKQHGDDVYLLINQSRLKLLPQDFKKLETISTYPKPHSPPLLLIKI